MSVSVTTQPRRVLLATDLSARCDRALDRAVALADAWNAQLLVLHVIEAPSDLYIEVLENRLPSWRRAPDATVIVQEQIRRVILPRTSNFTSMVESGDPVEAILRTAKSHACDLIVTGLARDETLGRFLLGGTVERLLRRAEVPLLVVRGRPRSDYQHIVVGTDFSDYSRHALQTALRLFLHQPLLVFHAYDAPMAGLAENPSALRNAYGKMMDEVCVDWLKTVAIPSERRSGIHQWVESGSARRLIHQYVRDRGVDLVVLGTRGRSALIDLFAGSITRDILSCLPCDALHCAR